LEQTIKTAEEAINKKDWPAAVKCLRDVLDDPAATAPAPVYVKLSQALRHISAYEHAEKVIKEGKEKYPGDTGIFTEHALISLMKEGMPAVIDEWKTFLKEHGEQLQEDSAEFFKDWKVVAKKYKKSEFAAAYKRMVKVYRRYDPAAAKKIVQKGLENLPHELILLKESVKINALLEDWDGLCLSWQELWEKHNDDKQIRRFIYKKDARPEDLEVQKKLFLFLINSSGISVHHKLNSITAFAYKSIESVSARDVSYAKQLIENNLYLVEKLEYDDNIRRHKTHVYYSMYLAYCHTLVYNREFEELKKVCRGLFDELGALDISNQTKGFYQTYACLACLLGIYYYLSFCDNDIEEMKKIIEVSVEITKKVSFQMDYHLVKFVEYAYAVGTISEMCPLQIYLEEGVYKLGYSGNDKDYFMNRFLPRCVHAKRKEEIMESFLSYLEQKREHLQ